MSSEFLWPELLLMRLSPFDRNARAVTNAARLTRNQA